MKHIILISGAPTVGKSFLAKRLANELDYPWISTDTIRGMMRQIVKPADYPPLFQRTEKNVEQNLTYLMNTPVAAIVDHQIAENRAVWQGVEGLIGTDYSWRSYIVEGVGIVPQLAAALIKNHPDKDIKTIFLIDTTRVRIVETFTKNGLWEPADRYSNKLREKDIAWILALDHWFAQECKKYSVPTISMTEVNLSTIKSLLKI